jgi:hypothetical protein
MESMGDEWRKRHFTSLPPILPLQGQTAMLLNGYFLCHSDNLMRRNYYLPLYSLCILCKRQTKVEM